MRGDRSTVLLGLPSFFRVTTILKHHSVGCPYGTRSRTPRATSRFNSSKTCSCQWSGTGAGLQRLTGTALGSMWNLTGGPFISGKGLCGHLLNVEFAYLFRSHCFIFGTFSGQGSNGSWSGLPGGGKRCAQSQDTSGTGFKLVLHADGWEKLLPPLGNLWEQRPTESLLP